MVIFFHCLSIELAIRKQAGEDLPIAIGGEVESDSLRQTYVMDANQRRKLQTVDYDDDLMRSFILHGTSHTQPKTHSGLRLKEAMEYMAKRMHEEKSTAELIRWMELVNSAVVTTFEVRSKEQATQIFAFQNDRGKDLTNLEKLKAYLMHVVYVHSPLTIQKESIRDLERKFSDIYRLTEEINSLKEDQVLAHHLIAFLPGGENPVNVLKKELKSKDVGLKRVEWIRIFCTNLVQSFQSVTKIETLKDGGTHHERLIGDVLYLNAPASWPLLLKLMHFHEHELSRLMPLLRLVEITLFKLQFMKGKSTNKLPNIANQYQSANLAALEQELKNVSQRGFQHYWDFNGEFRRFLEGSDHYDNKIKYLLWKYENKRRAENRDPHLSLRQYENDVPGQSLDASIDHVMPQNPEGRVHSEAFKKDYIHNLGNLVLMTKGRNSSLRNKMPIEKAADLRATTYISQQDVANTILDQKAWGENEISSRKRLIVDFALQYWQVSSEAPAQTTQP